MLRRPSFLIAAALLIGCASRPPEPPAVAPAPAAPAASEPEPEPEPEPEVDTTIEVLSGAPTEILLDGKPIGTTPIARHKVTPGTHEVTFVDPARGNRTMMVTVDEGDAKTVKSDPPPSIIESAPADDEKKK